MPSFRISRTMLLRGAAVVGLLTLASLIARASFNIQVVSPPATASGPIFQGNPAFVRNGQALVGVFLNTGNSLQPFSTAVSFDGGVTWTTGALSTGGPAIPTGLTADIAFDSTTQSYNIVAAVNTGAGGGAVGLFQSINGVSYTFRGIVYQGPPGSSVENPKMAIDNNLLSLFRGVYYATIVVRGDTSSNSANGINICVGISFTCKTVVSSPETPSNYAVSPEITLGTDGRLYVTWLDSLNGNESIKLIKSTDGGLTFSPPTTVTPLVTTGLNGDLGELYKTFVAPQVVIDPTNPNRIYFTYADTGSPGDHADIFFVRSTDGGTTFSRPIKVNNDATTTIQFNPSLTVESGSTLFAQYYTGEFGDDNHLDVVTVQITIDGVTQNVTLGPSVRITQTSFPALINTGATSNYIGEQNAIVPGPGGYDPFFSETGNAQFPNDWVLDHAFVALPIISGFSPTSAVTGTTVTINGSGFKGTISVAFNGVAATQFTVVSDTQIDAVVPQGATTGPITVTTPAGSFPSVDNFVVIPQTTVVLPPSITKTFSPTSIVLNGTTTLTITITNPNTNRTLPLTGITFTDTLPSGLVVISTPTSNCSVAPSAPTGFVSLSGASLGPGASCTVTVNVQGTITGQKANSVTVTATESGSQSSTATATLNVAPPSPPSLSKSFGAASIPFGGTTTLTFTIMNPNSPPNDLTGISFTDTLPAGLVVANPNGLTGTCPANTITAAGGALTLTGLNLAAGSNCTFTVNVTGTSAGTKTNITTAVTSNEAGNGNLATASITVLGILPPSLTKSFASPTIRLNGGATAVTFTITNPNQFATLTGISFTDNFPPGLVLTNPNGLITFCNGKVTADPGTAIVTLAGGSLPPNASCTFTVDVIGTTAGVKNNVTNAVTSNEAGPGNAAKDTVTVVAPPVINKSFGDVAIQLNAATTLTFTITNPNTTVALTGVSFADNMPAGLSVLTPSAFITGCPPGTGNSAGGLIVAFGGAVLPPSGSCSITVRVSGTAVGTKDNTTLPVNSNEGGQGNTASASITVLGPPLISKRFGAASVPLAGTTSLTFTITNPNDATLTGITFSDVLPSGLLIATPNGQTGTCGGIVSAVAGSNTISLSSTTLLPGASCTLSVNVIGIAVGTQNNVTGKISAAGVGTGGTASASINVIYSLCLLYDPTRAVQSGSTIPLKFQLCDANNVDVSSSAVVVQAVKLVQVSTNASEIIAAGNANPDSDFRFDASLGPTGGYIFNLKTTGLTTGTYALYFVVGSDPTTYVLSFQVR